MADRVQKATLHAGGRRYTISAYTAISPEEILVWMTKGEMLRLLTGEDLHKPIPRSVKDQLIKQNVGG